MPHRPTRTHRATSWLRILLVALLCLAAAHAWARSAGLLLPPWATFADDASSCDLDGDGTDEQVALIARRLRVADATGAKRYASPRGWQVARVLPADVDGNGTTELLMLVWRRGNYGSSRPFWDTGLDLRMTEHLYVLALRDGAIVPFWMGHELNHEVTELSFSPATRTLMLVERDGSTTSWRWEGFGFAAVDTDD